MATIKSYTDLEQSKKLVDILPLESADMSYYLWKDDGHLVSPVPFVLDGTEEKENGLFEYIPCWSLTALLNIIPTMIGSIFEKDALRLRMDKSETDFNIWYENLDTCMVEEGLDIIKSNIVDACYEMIIKLHELNLL